MEVMNVILGKGGVISVRMPKGLHLALKELANKRQISLNKLTAGILSAEICDVKRSVGSPAIQAWQRQELEGALTAEGVVLQES